MSLPVVLQVIFGLALVVLGGAFLWALHDVRAEIGGLYRAIRYAAPPIRNEPDDGAVTVMPEQPREFHYCRWCRALIESNAPGMALAWRHVEGGGAACEPIPGQLLTWAEPAIPDAWLAGVSRADLADVDDTFVSPTTGPRCRTCRTTIEPNPIEGGHPWRHVLGGPACWIQGGQRIPALFGQLAEPVEPIAAVDVRAAIESGAQL